MLEGKDKLVKVKQEVCPHDELIPFEEGYLECTTCELIVPAVVKRPCRYCDGTVLIFLDGGQATCFDCGEDYCPSEFGF